MSAIAGRVLLIPQGAYNALTTYNPLDFVTYGADSYVCKQTSTGNAPTNTTYWQLLAKGSTDADQIGYDNTASGLSATDVQAAVDELASEKQDKTLSSAITIEGTSQSTVEGALSGLNGYADNISDVISKNGAKNLLPNTAVSKSENGITFTVNSDGTVTVSGTASATTYLILADTVKFAKGTYKVSGTPSGGNLNTSYAYLVLNANDITQATDAPNVDGYTDTFTVSNEASTYKGAISIKSGTVISTPITFKPMIALASQPNSDYAHYVPYAMTNRELTVGKVEELTISASSNTYLEQNTKIAKNGRICVLYLDGLKNLVTSGRTILFDIPAPYKPLFSVDEDFQEPLGYSTTYRVTVSSSTNQVSVYNYGSESNPTNLKAVVVYMSAE